MRVIDDTLFIASSGGILAVTSPDQAGQPYVNVDGLGTNDITDIIKDADGQKWVAGFGRLIRFSAETSQQYLFYDVDDNLLSLNTLVDDGEYLWVATDGGLVLFAKNIDGGQIQDSYHLFGNLNPDPAIYDIELSGDSIWLATSAGLAVADRSDPLLLKSPQAWQGFSIDTNPELLTDTVMAVVRHNADIYVATRRLVFRLQLEPEPTFANIPVAGDSQIYELRRDNDSLFAYYYNWEGGGIAFIEADTAGHLSIDGLPSHPVHGASFMGDRWATSNGDIFCDASGEFTEYVYAGLPADNVTDIVVDREGAVTGGFGRVAAATRDDSLWNEYNFWVRDGITHLMIDSVDHLWMGTIGNGLWFWDGDTLINYDENNSPMRGNTDGPLGPAFVIINGLATDGAHLYALCFRALNDYPLVIGDIDNLDDPAAWDSVGVDNGLGDVFLVSMDLRNGQLAIGSGGTGVYLCGVGDDPLNADIECQNLTRENSLLVSNSVRVVKYAPDGALWVGTNFGLSRYDSGIDRFVDVPLPEGISSDITCLAFDGQGNAWIGTRDGLARRDGYSGEFEVFNTLNSDIVSDVINSVTFDRYTGDLYVATSSGFSFTPSEIGPPTPNIEEVVAFPNPFVITGEGDRLSFNYASPGVVRIFNAAGELVRETLSGLGWDGRNDWGEEVASGVYIYVITGGDGSTGKGKILLVRQ